MINLLGGGMTIPAPAVLAVFPFTKLLAVFAEVHRPAIFPLGVEIRTIDGSAVCRAFGFSEFVQLE